jgi:hypothetical protein
MAKIGVLAASVIAGVGGYAILRAVPVDADPREATR